MEARRKNYLVHDRFSKQVGARSTAESSQQLINTLPELTWVCQKTCSLYSRNVAVTLAHSRQFEIESPILGVVSACKHEHIELRRS